MSQDSLFDVHAQMRAFPQGQFYLDENIEKWLEAIRSFDAGREAWHLKRLTGIGGSEIGVLVGDLEGVYHPHQSAIEICRAKLLQHFPEPPNGDMLRGQIMEPIARDVYRKQILAQYPQAKPREDIMEALSDFRHPDHAWMVGNPDEIMELEPGKLFIIDYKCPTQTSFDDIRRNGPPFYYVAQLHHYCMLAEAKGYKIEGLQLASLDYKTFQVLIQPVAIDPEQLLKNKYAGDFFWNEFIMQNKVPTSGVVRRYGDRASLPDNLREAAVDYTILRHIANVAMKRTDKISDLARENDISLDPGIDQISIGLVSVKTKREINQPTMLAALKKAAPTLDLDELRDDAKLSGNKALALLLGSRGFKVPEPDDKKGWAALANDPKLADLLSEREFTDERLVRFARQLGVNLETHIASEEVSFSLGRPRKGDSYTNFMHEQISEVISQGVDDLAEDTRDKLIEIEQKFHSMQIADNHARRATKRRRGP
jgi:hypothetical protein